MQSEGAMAFDPEQFVLQGLGGLIGGLLGVSLGAWLTGFYKVRGELTGRAETLDSILSEVRATAKATEGTKIDTRLEKLDSVLHEVKSVTDAQKRIEASGTGSGGSTRRATLTAASWLPSTVSKTHTT
jgi:hypothetical protein